MKRFLFWFKMFNECGQDPRNLTTCMQEVEEVYACWMKIKQFGERVEKMRKTWVEMTDMTRGSNDQA